MQSDLNRAFLLLSQTTIASIALFNCVARSSFAATRLLPFCWTRMRKTQVEQVSVRWILYPVHIVLRFLPKRACCLVSNPKIQYAGQA
jgi:hypothetical protein